MTLKEFKRRAALTRTLENLGFDKSQVTALRNISTGLRRWYERECGDDRGAIMRDEYTGKPRWHANTHKAMNWPIPDLEAAHLRRLARIMAAHPALSYYLQRDPRGAALYILRPGDVPEGKQADSYYTNGICVY